MIDTSTGSASVVGRLPNPLAHASAIALGGRIYVLGGTAGDVPSASVLRFDPSAGRAIAAGRLPDAGDERSRQPHSAAPATWWAAPGPAARRSGP